MNSINGFSQMLLLGLLRIGKPRMGFIKTSFWLQNLGVGTMVALLAMAPWIEDQLIE